MTSLWFGILKIIALIFEIIGAIIVIQGGSVALLRWLRLELFRSDPNKLMTAERLRGAFGQRIVLGLEFFIAGDIIRTIFTPSLVELAKLGGIVVIRTVLHFSLGREIKTES